MSVTRLAVLLVAAGAIGGAQDADKEFFEKKIRPVLATKCYSCHTSSSLGGLRLDSRAAILKGGKSGPAIVEGNPDSSLLITAVKQIDPKLKMPMAGDKLSAQEIADLGQWIKSGAAWPEAPVAPVDAKKEFHITDEQRAFWSFQPLRKTPPPAVKDPAWMKTAIDRFVMAKLEEKDFKPTKPADKRVLIRRAAYDLTGLPPTPEQVDAFIADHSPDALAKVVDRLLASSHYGERWGRHWLDVARYADGEGGDRRRGNLAQVFIGYGMAKDGYVNTFRYRDWVINAFNSDMPYDQFVKAQIAGDQLNRKELLPGLGYFGLGPWFTGDDVVFTEARANERDDKIDALTKGFLGLTVTCARCHDHKYDPISQKDYYALGGVFLSSGYNEYNLAPENEVATYKEHLRKNREQQEAIKRFSQQAQIDVAEKLAARTPDYMMAVRKIVTSSPKPDAAKVAAELDLDAETLGRWVKYQTNPAQKQHPYLKDWDKLIASGGGSETEARKLAEDFYRFLMTVVAEQRVADAANEELKKNYKPEPTEARAALPGDLMQFELFQFKQSLVQKVIEPHKFYLYQELMDGDSGSINITSVLGMYEYKEQKALRHLSAEKKAELDAMQAKLKALSDAAPPEYPYLMGIADESKPLNMKVNVRGNPYALGDEVPRGFPAVLAKTDGAPKPFTKGSGRLELAEAIVSHPLSARVMANRIWMHHFGAGIVASPSNFGVTGERPSHAELLDYLAGRFVESNWSMKALHREIMLSNVYQLSADYSDPNQSKDPENKYLWRANVRRLEAESIRDSLLFVTGILDERVGGPPEDLASPENKKRTVYGRIRRSPDRMLTLFDFPEPVISGEQRSVTNVPLQSLFFMNSDMVWRQANLLAKRLEDAAADSAKIEKAYRLLYDRSPKPAELERGLKFIESARRNSPEGVSEWQRFAQALLSANEFYYVN